MVDNYGVKKDTLNGKNSPETDQSIDNVPPDLLKTYYCGCGPCHPKWLQIFARKKIFTFLLCVFSFLQSGLISGLISISISTIEKRYNFNSTSAGIMVISYDITAAIGIILISYFGSKTHRPKLLGVGAIVMGIGAFIFASPQFFFGRYEAGSNNDLRLEQCLDNHNYTSDCNAGNYGAYSLFILSNIVMGIAVTPLYTLGTAYIDEIVFPKYVSLHIGVYAVMLVAGPLIGYGFGSAFLKVYVDPWKSTSLTEEDPAWVGAWWIPFALYGIFLLLLSIPLLMFPRYLSDSYLVRQERAKEMAKIYPSKYANEDNLTIMAKMFPIHIKRLLLNASFMLMALGFSVTYIPIQGILSFAPKFYETQYKFTASTAGLVAGGVGLPGAILGTLTGAFLVFGCKTSGRKDALIVTIITLIILPLTLVFLLHCSGAQVAGITAPYGDGSQSGQDSSFCAQQCECTSTLFEPVCGADGLTYFSPCRAGCTRSGGPVEFENCTCIAESLRNNSNYSHLSNDANATNGFCGSRCIIVIPALFGIFLLIFAAFVIQMPYVHFMLRVVADDQRALALGLQSSMNRIIGGIPGPLITGALFDVACALWQTECGRQGNCWLYNNKRLSLNVTLLALPCIGVALVLFFLAWLTYPKRQDKRKKKEEIELVDTN